MRVTDIIRGFLDLLDQANQRELDTMTPPAEPESDVVRIQRMAGIVTPDTDPHYNNTPDETVQPVAAVITTGTDVNRSKHPADIRTNAPSMYPGHQSGCRE